MAITSPALSLSVEALFGAVKPVLDGIRKLGTTDFSADKPGVEIKPGATIKYPISSIAAASAYDASSNNYLTGGTTSWGTLTATHYLQGFDLSGENLDQGVNSARIKQLFAVRAGKGISLTVQNALKSALDAATVSTGVTVAASGTATLTEWMGLAADKAWLNRATSVLAVNGATLGEIKGLFAAAHILGSDAELASYMGFKDLVLVPGMTARAAIIPDSTIGFVARVPQIIARFAESGIETDDDSGLSIGIVVADDQAKNRQIVNCDLWFGCAVMSSNAGATTSGVIKVGTTAAA